MQDDFEGDFFPNIWLMSFCKEKRDKILSCGEKELEVSLALAYGFKDFCLKELYTKSMIWEFSRAISAKRIYTV